MVIITMIFASILILSQFKFEKKNDNEKITFEQKMFLSGAGIYLGTFATTGNVDYRLVFLLLTIPFLLKESNKSISYFYFISLACCFNSLVFEGGDSYSLIYFLKASFIYLLKLIIFIVNCFYFGKILNKFIDVSFLLRKT